MTVNDIHNKFSYVNRQLLSDAKRNQVTRMTDGKGYNNQAITDVITNYKDKRDDLVDAVSLHPYLAMRLDPVVRDSFVSILDKTKYFTYTDMNYSKTNITADKVVKGS